jgi:hypothetical protein
VPLMAPSVVDWAFAPGASRINPKNAAKTTEREMQNVALFMRGASFAD